MKKLIAILLILTLAFTLFACGKEKEPEEQPDNNQSQGQQEVVEPTYDTPENDPTYIEKEDTNYVTEDEKEAEKKANEVDEDYSDVPYVEEEVATSDEERRAMEGWSAEDVMAQALPKSYTLTVYKDGSSKTSNYTYKSGDALIPELKGNPFQAKLDSKMTADGMEYLLTVAQIGNELVLFQYTINLVKKRVNEVQLNWYDSGESKNYTFKY